MNKTSVFIDNVLLVAVVIFVIFVPFSKHFVKLSLGFGFVLWIISSWLKHKNRFLQGMFPFNILKRPLLLFLASAVLSTLFSIDLSYSQQIFFQRYVPYLLVFFLGYYIVTDSRRNLEIIILSLVIVAAITGLGGIGDYFGKNSRRLFSSWCMGIDWSAFLPIFIPLSFGILIFSKKKLFRLFSLISLTALLPVLIWHGGRSPWISVSVTLLLLCFVKFKKSNLIFLSVLIIAGFFLMSSGNIERFKSLSKPFSRETLKKRIDLAGFSFEVFKKFPLTGAGPGMFEFLYSSSAKPQKRPGKQLLHSHNNYLEIAAEMGILGLVSFVGIFLIFFKTVFKNINNINTEVGGEFLGLFGVIFAVFIICFAISLVTVGVNASSLFWFLLGISINVATSDYYSKNSIVFADRTNFKENENG